MFIKDLLEGRHPYNKYYKPKPAHLKKPKPRPKKTLWYNDYNSWVADIKTRFPNARAYYDEENEEIIAACENCKECYGKWSKRKEKFNGFSFYKPRQINFVTRNYKKLHPIEKR